MRYTRFMELIERMDLNVCEKVALVSCDEVTALVAP